MKIPKLIRRWKYKRILKTLAINRDRVFLCHECAYKFPFISIKYYPELWDRKETCDWYDIDIIGTSEPLRRPWFIDNESRIKYVEEALELLNNK